MIAAARPANDRSAAGDRNPWLIAIVVSIATFMLVLDSSIANVALRNIAGDLAAGLDESTWIITTYLVANAVIIPVSGWLSSVIGRKRYYMICVATFTLASVLCGLAVNLPMLIAFRILQGLGGGGMAPSEQSILADTFPPQKRAQAFALYGVAVIVAPTVGPTLGGWLTDNFSWHWIFFINLPFGVLSLILVQWLLVEPPALEREREERLRHGLHIDWVGFLLVAGGLGSLEIVLDKGQRDDWFSSSFIVTFSVMAAVCLVVLFIRERMQRDPIVDVRLLFHRQFGTAFLVMMSVGAVLFGSTQILPQLLQTNFAYTDELSGLSMMPGGVAMLLMMPLAGFIAGKVQPKYLIAIGMAVVALAMWHMTSLTPAADFDYFVWARVFQMIGLPLLFIPINSAAYAGLPPDSTNQASALINVARNLGGSIGVSLANTEIVQRSQFHQARLVEHVAPSSLSYLDASHRVTDFFTAQGADPVTAGRAALAWIGQAVQNQATLLAYGDAFWVAALFAGLMVPLVLLMLRPIDMRAGTAAH